ncbi:HAD family hydrolase [Rossellomorea aquimaris]|jgi:phosphoglycolate phosphatase|uniref:HAD family hydrolase n=1 Tax=Rossellomorea aquimaris TaxID=189382 RepID=A0A5D4U3R2_9BACI|nr:HAD family hydrolase [Rossellomorea aquimaris]TYS81957.1 HAD family hydrolase [Rossellomorea aquimaris]TYS88580.1 HAD family hydrolase [Rossellomorea aquimaris]
MDSIIFDLDGTLWDPIESVLEAWNSVINEHNQLKEGITRKHLEETMGLQMKEIGKRLFPELNEEEREKLLKNLSRHEIPHLSKHGGSLYHHVEEVIVELSKKYKLFIVSNCQDGYIEAFYEYHGLDKHFIDYENPGRTGLSKGENIKLIIERNHLNDPVYVGDTEGDQKAAKEAGIPFIYARYGFGEAEEYTQAVDSFDELLNIF